MRILAIDTATGATAVALLDEQTGTSFQARDNPPAGGRPGHTEKLLSLCERVLNDAGLSWNDLDRLAVGTGPGTFTGMRIGIATAHALAQSTGTPLVGVSTLDALTAGAWHERGPAPGQPERVVAVIDARRGEAFVGGAGLTPAVIKPSEFADRIGNLGATFAVGDGAIKFRAQLQAAGAAVPPDGSPLHLVDAVCHCKLALTLTPGKPTDVQPQYIRIPDAELSLRANDGP
jgi:tRNA threonylcarbamoyladenosine biosynthesis protein TsaB